MRKDLQDFLRADNPLTECLAEHKDHSLIYWVSFPRGAATKYPGITLSVVSPTPRHDQKGILELTETRVQVDAWAKGNLQKAIDAMKAVEVRLDIKTNAGGQPLTVGQTVFERIYAEGARDMPVVENSDGVDIYHITGDFVIWHRQLETIEQQNESD